MAAVLTVVILLWLLLCCVMKGYLTSVAYCVVSWRGDGRVVPWY